MFVSLDLSEREYDKVVKVCQKKVGTPFDMIGMVSVCLGRLAVDIGACDQSFCTKLISAVMVSSGIFPQEFNVFNVTPKSLHDYVVDQARGTLVPTPYGSL